MWLAMAGGRRRLLTVSALLGHTQVTTTNTHLASSPAVAEKEFRGFEERRGTAFPNLSQTVLPDPSGFEKAPATVHLKAARKTGPLWGFFSGRGERI